MAMFHLSYDIAESSDITILKVVQFLCGELLCDIKLHRTESTLIFESGCELDYIASRIEMRFPQNCYYELSEIKHGRCKGKQNPKIEDDYCSVCKIFRNQSKIK